MVSTTQKVGIVIPVYNDWESLKELIRNIEHLDLQEDLKFIIVNDCSSQAPLEISIDLTINIINLKINVGHQRAIAIGLAHCHNLGVFSEVIVMDSDGEDNPIYIPKLLDKSRELHKIVFAKRVKRQENFIFKSLYLIYKLIFKILVGRTISFGNYSVIDSTSLDKIIFVPDLWNHLSASIIRSKIPYTVIDTARAKRYSGKSKMNLSSLIIHGFSAISIFIENVFTRIIFWTMLVFMMCITLSGVVLYRKLYLELATPGWATTSLFGFTIVSLLMTVFCFLIGLSYLNNRKEQMDINFFKDNYIKFIKD